MSVTSLLPVPLQLIIDVLIVVAGGTDSQDLVLHRPSFNKNRSMSFKRPPPECATFFLHTATLRQSAAFDYLFACRIPLPVAPPSDATSDSSDEESDDESVDAKSSSSSQNQSMDSISPSKRHPPPVPPHLDQVCTPFPPHLAPPVVPLHLDQERDPLPVLCNGLDILGLIS